MALTQITEKGIKDGELVNADVNASAAIAKSKLASLDIVNADVNASAAIAKSKLASLDIVNADVNASAAIAGSKLAAASGSAAGSMSAAHYTKVEGIAASANNYTHPNHSGDVTSSADGATTIADNAVTLAKMASGTDGQIITYDASGDPIAVGPGTDGQVLTSTGAGSPPAFEDVPAGGAALTGSTNNTITTVTGANAIQGEANLTFDGTTLKITDTELEEASDNFSINIQSGNNDFYVKSGGTTIAAFKGQDKHLEISDGNLVIATSGHGIDFSATGGPTSGSDTSELLDDYEEGTFNPYFGSGTGGGTLSAGSNYAHQTGHYVKVGNVVHCQIDLKCASSGTGSISGELRIENLPYGNDGNAGVVVGFGLSQNITSDHPNAGYMFSGGGTHLWLQKRTTDTGEASVDASDVVNNTRIVCGITYKTV